MANPLQTVKNASKLISQAIVNRDKDFERTAKTILKAVVSELNTALKGKELRDLVTGLEKSEAIEFDVYGLLKAVDEQAREGNYTYGDEYTLRIKRITWDGKWAPLEGRDATDRPYQFDLRITVEKGIEEDMECIIHLG